jgi:hypothetical protein
MSIGWRELGRCTTLSIEGNPIRVIVYRRDGVWLAQGVDADIRTRLDGPEEARAAFLRALRERLALNKHVGREAWYGIKAAPSEFEEMFKKAKATKRESSSLDNGEVEVRLAA